MYSGDSLAESTSHDSLRISCTLLAPTISLDLANFRMVPSATNLALGCQGLSPLLSSIWIQKCGKEELGCECTAAPFLGTSAFVLPCKAQYSSFFYSPPAVLFPTTHDSAA